MEEEPFWQGPSFPIWVLVIIGVLFLIVMVAWLFWTLEYGLHDGWVKAKVLGYFLMIPMILLLWLTGKSQEE